MKDIRGALRQGGVGSMEWFAIGIDPLLIFLEQNLNGIPIISLAVHGPVLEFESFPLPCLEERFKFMAYCADVKPAITSIEEFNVADKGASLFEKAAGTRLHRDPNSNKCKFLPLGKWRKELNQDMIPTPYMKLTDTLDMVGVQICALWSQTRKKNGDLIRQKVQKLVGGWRSGKFLPLLQRPFSANTYALSLVWFKSSCINLRESDFASVSSSIKKWLYADLIFKPEETVLFREVKNGGLGLVSTKHKSLAFLIKNFLELAINPVYIRSIYLNVLYRFHILGEQITAPPLPPYYSQEFFNRIIQARNSGKDIVKMSVKDWYLYLVKCDILMIEHNQESLLRPCRVERIHNDVNWSAVWVNVRQPALSNKSKSFAWKLSHDLLPTDERLSVIPKTSTGTGVCRFGCIGDPCGDLEHCLFWCQMTKDVGQWLLDIHKLNYPNVCASNVLRLDLSDKVALTLLTIKTFEYSWYQRAASKKVKLADCIASISADLEILDLTRYRHISGEMKQLLRVLD